MIRSAKEWGQRPTAVIMRDASFGGGTGWIPWDYDLISALQLIEDHSDEHGLLVWEKNDSERVEVAAEKKIDRFRAQVDRITGGSKYKPTPGEYFVPRLILHGDEWPTYKEFIQSQIEELE